MCGGQDANKPHLHYSADSRAIAQRLEGLTGLGVGDVLRVTCAIGLSALLDNMVNDCKEMQSCIDGMQFARLMSTRALSNEVLRQLKKEFQFWVDDPIKPMRLTAEELPF